MMREKCEKQLCRNMIMYPSKVFSIRPNFQNLSSTHLNLRTSHSMAFKAGLSLAQGPTSSKNALQFESRSSFSALVMVFRSTSLLLSEKMPLRKTPNLGSRLRRSLKPPSSCTQTLYRKAQSCAAAVCEGQSNETACWALTLFELNVDVEVALIRCNWEARVEAIVSSPFKIAVKSSVTKRCLIYSCMYSCHSPDERSMQL